MKRLFLLFVFPFYILSESALANPSTSYQARVFSGTEYGLLVPIGIYADSKSNIWIANAINNKSSASITQINALDPSAKPKIYSGSQYQFSRPNHVIVDSKANMWVLNDDPRVTQIPLNNSGNPNFYSAGIFNGLYTIDKDMIVDVKDNIWIIDASKDRVVKIPSVNPNSPEIYDAPEYGFGSAVGLTSDSKGNIWVVNKDKSSVTKIPAEAPTHPIIYKDDSVNSNKYHFNYPSSIGADSQGNIWVVSKNNITELPADHPNEPITYPVKSTLFSQSTRLTIDTDGNVWVTDPEVNEVVEFKSNHSYQIYSANRYHFHLSATFPNAGITTDKMGNIWIVNTDDNSVTELVKTINKNDNE
jgi:streptogramin lyase